MRLIDLSQPMYHDSPNCPAHPPVRAEILVDHPGSDWRLEMLTIASHTGSHLDAPLHKIAGGRAIDELPLETFVGDAHLVDLRESQADRPIGPALLLERLRVSEMDLHDHIILLATGWGDRRAKSDEWLNHSPYLTVDGAEWLVERRVRGVGIDHYGIAAREPENTRCHEILLGAAVWIVEELRFPPEVFDLPQPVRFWALPINFRGFSGSFCRPVVVVE